MRYNHLDMLPEKAFQPVGKRMTLEGGGKGGGGGGTTTSTSTNLPTYAKPYYQELLKQTGKNIFETDADGYVTGIKGAEELPQQTRIGLTEEQRAGMAGIQGLQTPGQFAQATQGLGAGQNMGYGAAMQGFGQAFGYQPQNINNQQVQNANLFGFQMAQPQNVSGMVAPGASMQAAQSSFMPNVTAYQMYQPRDVNATSVGTQMFGQDAANYYMSPYAQAAINPTIREARLQGDLQKQAGMLGSIGRGTFGGARQALLQAEQERGTQRNISDIQAIGMDRAYQNAQAQFQADQARQLQAAQANQQTGLQAALANQQAGLSTGQQNLAAQLSAQQLGVSTGAQMALANLNNEQQANVQNLAAQLQTQGLNADQALKAALANQQSALTTGQQNLSALLGVQQLGAGQSLEAQKANQAAALQAAQLTQQGQQYAAGLGKDIGLAGLSAGIDTSKALGAMGTEQQNAELARLQAQISAGDRQQAQLQGESDTDYQNRMAALNYEKQQLQFYSDILRGNAGALDSTQVQYAPPPSAASQVGGLGLAKAMG